MRNKKFYLIILGAFLIFATAFLEKINQFSHEQRDDIKKTTYIPLPKDTSEDNPLIGINNDFTPNDHYETQLPIIIINTNEIIPRYISTIDGAKPIDDFDTTDINNLWVSGTIRLISNNNGAMNHLSDESIITSDILIKRRGHSSMYYDKPQYKIKTISAAGEENPIDFLSMGDGSNWVLNGSMADKSMLRNYVAYRIASEIQAETPDCRFCEVFLNDSGTLKYQGVYLLTESIARGKNRIDIDEAKKKNVYTSYIVRRDRYNLYDVMLDTWGRKNGMCPDDQWIGIKYPSKKKLSNSTIEYISRDFSNIEKVIYSDDKNVFNSYNRYINSDSFVDYFIINEFFGNYDSGEHSTYMWKQTGGKLNIGPVWDFDQAMNNVFSEEQNPYTLAMTEKPIFKQLTSDRAFIDKLVARYAYLRNNTLSEEHVFSIIDEAQAHLKNAQQREWFRWAADYMDNSRQNPHNYYLDNYELDGITLDRFNTDYNQEIYTIKTYLSIHGRNIATELKKLHDPAKMDSKSSDITALILIIVLLMFITPSFLINKRK